MRLPHDPPPGAVLESTEIDPFFRDPGFEDETGQTYRVRKVERYSPHGFKKYALSWTTGEWIEYGPGKPCPDECMLQGNRKKPLLV